MEEIRQILAGLDWSPLFISIKTGIAATIVSFFLGIWAARKVLKAKTGLRAVLDGILTLSLVLPPTVAGFFLLLIFSTRRTVGSYLYTTFDIKIVQSWAGCVIAATVIAFPLMYRNARAAFEQVDVNLIYAAQTLGMPEWKIFWRVIMPAAGPGVAIRYNSCICKSAWRIRCDLPACGQYSRKDGNHFPEDCNGHPGR